MALRIKWSIRAHSDRKKILEFWWMKTGSKSYSKKLNFLFSEGIRLISEFPEIGKRTDFENVRAKRVHDYYIFYEIQKKDIWILTIWDTRRNPEKLKNPKI